MASRIIAIATLGLALAGCVDEHHSVVSTARTASEPWTCPEATTTVEREAFGGYRLSGCGVEANYMCEFSLDPPQCRRQ
jgi:hypothetical protein